MKINYYFCLIYLGNLVNISMNTNNSFETIFAQEFILFSFIPDEKKKKFQSKFESKSAYSSTSLRKLIQFSPDLGKNKARKVICQRTSPIIFVVNHELPTSRKAVFKSPINCGIAQNREITLKALFLLGRLTHQHRAKRVAM